MTAPVERHTTPASFGKAYHRNVPPVAAERPWRCEDDRPTGAPIPKVNFGAIAALYHRGGTQGDSGLVLSRHTESTSRSGGDDRFQRRSSFHSRSYPGLHHGTMASDSSQFALHSPSPALFRRLGHLILRSSGRLLIAFFDKPVLRRSEAARTRDKRSPTRGDHDGLRGEDSARACVSAPGGAGHGGGGPIIVL